MEVAMCKKDYWRTLMLWFETEDSHNEENPFQPFPDKPHLFFLTRQWETERRLLVPKSRQMSATWLFCALYLCDSIFLPSRFTIFSSKKENDAIHLIERTALMWQRLPKFMREMNECTQLQASLKFANRSVIKGVPAGADQVRSLTLTGIFSDEMAFQEEAAPMLAAAIPTLGKNGRITCVSSAGPSYFAELISDSQ